MWFSEAVDRNDDPLLDADVPPTLSTHAIETLLTAQPTFDASGFRRQAAKWAERNRAVPMMAISFHRHLIESGNIPSFQEYMDRYEDDNRDTIASLGGPEGLRHRVARAYPSLVRDVHFVSAVRELGVPATRTLRMDLDGVDALVGSGDDGVPVRLYFASPQSRRHKLAKAVFHEQVSDIVDVGLTRAVSISAGGIRLYSPAVVRDFLVEVGILEVSQ